MRELGISCPILQAPVGGAAGERLAAAASSAGALGAIHVRGSCARSRCGRSR